MLPVASQFRLDFNPLVGEARRRARRRRTLTAAFVLLTVALGLFAVTSPHGPARPLSASGAGDVSDGVVRAALPPGWSASVRPGFDRTHPVAWLEVGDFRLRPGAARHEGTPSVPQGSVLVAIGDFFPEGRSRDWRKVTTLRMPRAFIVSGRWWSVRYAGRALSVKVTFGSGSAPALVDKVERLLGGVHHVG